MVKALWGHLPERSREQMLQSFSDEFLPKYELEIEQYYRRLSEEQGEAHRSKAPADTGLVSFLLVIWFFISFIGPELKLPDATLRLSAFYYYGTPLLHGLQLTSVLVVVAVTAIALGLGAVRFMRKDIAA